MITTKKSPATWSGFRGVNLTALYTSLPTSESDPLGYAADCYTVFDTLVPDATLAAIRANGFDYVRLATNCIPMLIASDAGNDARVAVYLSDVEAIIDAIVAADFNVIFDVHNPPSHPEWGGAAILAGLDPDGAKLEVLKAVETQIATMLLKYSPRRVCMEILNEPPEEVALAGINAAWSSTLCQSLFDVVRAANSGISIIVSGAEYGNLSALVGSAIDATTDLPGLTPSQFDANTIYSFHHYDPHYLSHCGYPGAIAPSSYAKYCDGISFPFYVDGARDDTGMNAAIATATANINADGALSSPQKTSYISGVTSALTDVYTNLGVDWATRYISGRLRLAAQWADENALDRSQILMGEFGAHMGTRGVTQNGRDNWYSMVRRAAEQQNYRWSVWNWYEASGFRISSDNLTMATTTKSALGLS